MPLSPAWPLDPVWIAVLFSALAALLAGLALLRAGGGELAALRLDLAAQRGGLVEEMRQGRAEGGQREKAMREEIALILQGGFARSDEGARALREEVGRRFPILAEGLNASLTGLGMTQGQRLDSVVAGVRALAEANERRLTDMRREADEGAKLLRVEVSRALTEFGALLGAKLDGNAAVQKERLDAVAERIHALATGSAEAGERLRETVEGRLDKLRTENGAKLDEMRQTVDEKLQGTLNERLGASFKQVSDGLEQVFRSVGEMQSLATGVGDLKRVLTNVKTRGTWAEVSLGSMLEQVMTPDQFARNVEVVPGSGEVVEYAVRLPGDGEGPVWLPIDAKFPAEDYERLLDASERADAVGVEAALKGLEQRVRHEGAQICKKYISPPHSTDFGIMFLPTEGLYAEVIRRPGLVDDLQRKCRIVVAGPTVLLAIMSSLRMGFRTLAIQER